jgi:3-oxoacyl-[acyl-carrier-protein] synthase-3
MGRSSSIVATNYELPEKILTYEELEERFGPDSMKKVLSGSGIRNRRVAPPGVCGSDLAYNAACRLLEYHHIDRQEIDLLIFCTQTPDYFLPTSAAVLQHRLGLKKQCASFDINLGCSQYVYALAVAHSMISTGVCSKALVLTGDTMTRTVHPKDRSVVPLLGDGGSATLVSEVPDNQGFLGFELGTDGSGYQYLMIPAGAFRRPPTEETAREVTDAEGNVRSAQNLYMNGAAIFHFAISVVPPTVERLLAKVSLSLADVDLFLFHQASKYMLDYLFKKMRIPPEKTHVFVEDIGNTSGSALPIVMAEAWRAGRVRAGARVLMIAFGVGLSWAATLVRWPQDALGVVPAKGI